MELRDDQGRSVEGRSILVGEGEGVHAVTHFALALPFTPKARELIVLRGDEVLLKQAISARPPQLSALTVKREPGDKLAVRWTAPGDSTRLWHKVRYSADGGQTWLGVVVSSATPNCELDLGRLPGGEKCLVEVYTSDGIATARLRSATFKVNRKPPKALIASPEKGKRLADGWVRLLGAGIDQGGRAIAKERLLWRSNRDGELGRGDLLDVQLSPGAHTLRLTVRDAVEREGSAEVGVRVSA